MRIFFVRFRRFILIGLMSTFVTASLGFGITPDTALASSKRDAIVNKAQWYKAQPNYYTQDYSYRTGVWNTAKRQYGFDCSGFVYRVYEDTGNGKLIKDSSVITDELNNDGKLFSATDYNAPTPPEIQPGDLIFFGTHEHVGIVTKLAPTIGRVLFVGAQTDQAPQPNPNLPIAEYPINAWNEHASVFNHFEQLDEIYNVGNGADPTTQALFQAKYKSASPIVTPMSGPDFVGHPVGTAHHVFSQITGTGGWIQRFQGGAGEDSILTLIDGSSSVYYTHNGIFRDYKNFNKNDFLIIGDGSSPIISQLGWPTSDEQDATRSIYNTVGYFQYFERGTIHWYKDVGHGFQTNGRIQDIYHDWGGSGGKFGFPTNSTQCWPNPDDCHGASKLIGEFEGGTITVEWGKPDRADFNGRQSPPLANLVVALDDPERTPLPQVSLIPITNPTLDGPLYTVEPLTLSYPSPQSGQSVTAHFTIRNVTGQTITVQQLTAGARQGTSWNDPNVDFPIVGSITLTPNAEYTYQQSRTFSGAGSYFAQPTAMINNSWSNNVAPYTNKTFFTVVQPDGPLYVTNPLQLSPAAPTTGQSIQATFTVKNVTNQALVVQQLTAGARQGTDWNGVNNDFPIVGGFTLQPGQEYTYQQSRTITVAGSYFAQPTALINNNWTSNVAPYFNKTYFTVIAAQGPLYVTGGLQLSPATPQVGQTVQATFTVQNVTGQALVVQQLTAGARQGTDWNGANNDFPLVGPFTLQPGQTYSYQQSRTFGAAGNYFAQPTAEINNNWTSNVAPYFNKTYFTVNALPQIAPTFVGQGSSRQLQFQLAYNRAGGSGVMGAPYQQYAYWWNNRLVRQDYNWNYSRGRGNALLQDENWENAHGIPAGTCNAYYTLDGIGTYYEWHGNFDNFGAPTSDQYSVNGANQQSFSNGYIRDAGGGNYTSVPWNTVSTNGWRIEYYNNTLLGCGLSYLDSVPNLNFDQDWSTNRPVPGVILSTNWSARLTRTETIADGIYTITAGSDDGVRVWLDNTLLIDQWVNRAYATNTWTGYIPGGSHQLKVEYFNGDGPAHMSFALQPVNIAVGANSANPQAFSDAYARGGGQSNLGYPLSGAQEVGATGVYSQPLAGGQAGTAMIVQDTTISSDPTVIHAYAILGVFTTAYINTGGAGGWLKAPTSDTYTAPDGSLRQNFGGGFLSQSNGTITTTAWPTTFSGWRAEYYNTPDLTGGASLIRDETTDVLDLGWPDGSGPAPQMGLTFATQWSGRWSRSLSVVAGYNKFSLCGSGNLRLYLDSALVVSQWQDQSLSCFDYIQFYREATQVVAVVEFAAGEETPGVSLSVNQVSAAVPAPYQLHIDVVAPTHITLSWTNTTFSVDSFTIERASRPTGPWQKFTLANVNATEYDDSQIKNGATYCYRVSAASGTTPSDYSTTICTKVAKPLSPTKLKAVAGASGIQLTWTDRANNEESFVLERRTSSTSWTQLTSFPAHPTEYAGPLMQFTDTQAATGETYQYRIRAANSIGVSSNSNVAKAKAL